MSKKILFYSLMLSSYIFGMDSTDKRLELCCVVQDEPCPINQFFNVTFKKCPLQWPRPTFHSAIIVDDPYCFRVHLPNAVRSYLAQREDIFYHDSFLTSKEATIHALQNVLPKENRSNNDDDYIIMTINFHQTSDFAHLEGRSCLIEMAKLPQSIKDRCPVINSSEFNVQNFYILLPLALLFFLYRFS